jgi:hypothetical protein
LNQQPDEYLSASGALADWRSVISPTEPGDGTKSVGHDAIVRDWPSTAMIEPHRTHEKPSPRIRCSISTLNRPPFTSPALRGALPGLGR